MKQNNKMSSKNNFVSNKFRIEIQISNNNKNNNSKKNICRKKRTLNNKTKNEKTMKKNVKILKTLKTLKEYFNNSSIVIFKKKKMSCSLKHRDFID